MASSSAATASQYLAELPPDRRAVMARMRELVRANLPAGYEEGMDYGMIVWSIPLARFPETYNGHPLGYVALAAQKHYYALYLSTYMSEGEMAAFERAFADAGKRMDMGKSCLRFKALDELPLDVVGREIARTPPDELIAMYERSRGGMAGASKTQAKQTKAKAKTATRTKAATKTKTATTSKTATKAKNVTTATSKKQSTTGARRAAS